jgi:hydrogenase maturation protein HypF
LVEVQHHFAHIASVLADNAHPLDGSPVIGVALDGLGLGDDGTLWGGEFLLADYRGYRRLAHLKPAPLPGGAQAMREPWRNTYAHLATHVGWDNFAAGWVGLELAEYLGHKPLRVLAKMLERGINVPPSSSCGRLFDAVAAALGLAREQVSYEGQAAIELETLAAQAAPQDDEAYPFAVDTRAPTMLLDPAPMWLALLDDLRAGVEAPIVAARFHAGLAAAVAGLAARLAAERDLGSVALSGGVMQNRTLFEAVSGRLERAGLQVFKHLQVPANDGGLALGQAVVAAARQLDRA